MNKIVEKAIEDIYSWECLECITCTLDSQNKCRNLYNSIKKSKERIQTSKPQTGDILIDGIIYRENLPFPLLQDIKRQKIGEGFDSSRIKITYTKKK
jgi:hypothetical protein